MNTEDFNPMKDNLLGRREQEFDGEEYRARFSGVGFVDSNRESTLFADIPHDDILELTVADTHAEINGEGGVVVPEERTLEIGDLVPQEWMGEQIVYEIIVRAKRLNPPLVASTDQKP